MDHPSLKADEDRTPTQPDPNSPQMSELIEWYESPRLAALVPEDNNSEYIEKPDVLLFIARWNGLEGQYSDFESLLAAYYRKYFDERTYQYFEDPKDFGRLLARALDWGLHSSTEETLTEEGLKLLASKPIDIQEQIYAWLLYYVTATQDLNAIRVAVEWIGQSDLPEETKKKITQGVNQ